MAATIHERFKSQLYSEDDKGGGSGELGYDIFGCSGMQEARDLLFATAPPAVGILVRKQLQVEPVGQDYRGQWWQGKASYGSLESAGLPQSGAGEVTGRVAFRIGLSSRHINVARETGVPSYDGAFFLGGAPDFGGGINPVTNGDGTISFEGTDILVPEATWEETYTMLDSKITKQYRLAALKTVGKVNDAPFREAEKGEVLFLGLTGSKANGGYWEVTHAFAYQENFQNRRIGTAIQVSGEGWWHVSVLYKEVVENGQLVKKPAAAYPQRVYDYADFSVLGIGVD